MTRVGRAAGALLAVLATVVTAACTDTAGPPIEAELVEVSATGRVFTLDGTPPFGLRAFVVGGAHTTSAAVSGDGTFTITGMVPAGTWDVIIDVVSGVRPTLPVLVRFSTDELRPTDISILLVPRVWQITGGTYANASVEISLDAAFRPPCNTDGDANCDGFFPTAWSSGIKLWPAGALPIRVAFDRTRTTQPITWSDSIQFWQTAQRMNADYGTPLFRPAREHEIAVDAAGIPSAGILVRIDTTIAAGFGAWTNWWWNGAGQLVAGVVRPRTTAGLTNVSLMTHELLHTHGFKHSCSWTTVMGGYGCGAATRLSPADVAYAQLAVRIAAVQRTTGAKHALLAARDGERVVLRGLDPLGAQAAARWLTVRGDSLGEVMGDHAH